MTLAACHCCGLIQQLPAPSPGLRNVCARCGTALGHRDPDRNRWTVALSLSALLLYPAAIGLPMLRVERLGHSSTDSLLGGLVSMISQGHWLLGGVILLLSLLLPPLKLLALCWLSSLSMRRRSHRYRAGLYHAVELSGRWGMLDVMLVAILVAMVKLGDLLQIHPGPGVWAFTLMVCFSLFASMLFDPHALWKEEAEP